MFLPFLNSRVTEPKFTKYLQDVARSSRMKLLKLELRHSTSFRNAKVTNEDESADFTFLTLKLVAMAMSIKRSENSQISNLRSNIYPEWRYCNPFGMSALRIKLKSPILPIMTTKLVAMAMSLEPYEQRVRWAIYDQIPTIW